MLVFPLRVATGQGGHVHGACANGPSFMLEFVMDPSELELALQDVRAVLKKHEPLLCRMGEAGAGEAAPFDWETAVEKSEAYSGKGRWSEKTNFSGKLGHRKPKKTAAQARKSVTDALRYQANKKAAKGGH